ncbi:MAG: sarcosine oxidase subunit beta [Candidatus Paceibacteria bacterium]|jgi:sarcosine oxidase subunit beta
MGDILILGGGIIGCSIGLELARLGQSVIIIERNGEVGHGTTAASCAIIRRFYSTDTMTAMAQEGAAVWSTWGDYLGAGAEEDLARFIRCGMLFVPPTLSEGVRSTIQRMEDHNVDVEWLSAEAITQRFPYLDVASQTPVRDPNDDDFFETTGRQIEGAVFERDAGYVISPALATRNLRDAAERAGVTFRLGEEVVAIEDSAARYRLRLASGGTIDGHVLINCAGPHSSVVNQMAGVDIGIEVRPLRREVHAVSNPAHEREGADPVPIVGDVDGGLYFRPETGGVDLIVGSLDPECDAKEWVTDPDSNDDNSTVANHERFMLRLMKRFPEIQLERRRGLGSMYDVTTLDWNPVLDCTDRPGYYVAIGTSGSSFKTAPVIGRVMAELVQYCEAGNNHDKEPVQVSMDRTGFSIDVGFFSRLRGAHSSSNTVLG